MPYVDDLKVYVASENKLQRMMKNVKDGMCIHDKRGSLISNAVSIKINSLKLVNCLREDSHCKFLKVR